MAEPRFTPETFRFLTELSLNNSRSWFEANKARYEALVREPALAFIRGAGPHLRKISPHLVASDRKVGGSLMRIHRDVRFSKNKQPYKTNLGIQFRHEAGKDVHAPGLYFHVDPRTAFLAVGMWHPDAASLAAVRQAIAGDTRGWKRVRDAKRFRQAWELAGESLKRAPLGYPADHPMIEDLKRKDFIGVAPLTQSVVTRADFPKTFARVCRTGSPLVKFLCKAIDVPY